MVVVRKLASDGVDLKTIINETFDIPDTIGNADFLFRQKDHFGWHRH